MNVDKVYQDNISHIIIASQAYIEMSTIFNYDAPGVARRYEQLRKPFGSDVVAGLIQIHSGTPLKVLYYHHIFIIVNQ